MKENLSKNIAITLLIEFLSCVMLFGYGLTDSPLFVFWLFATVIINSIAVFLLLRYKTRFYILLALLCLITIATPPLTLLYAISKIKC